MEAWVVNITIFVLAVFIGDHVIRGVTPALHTPLMSLTNALSGIVIVGALLEIAGGAGATAGSLADIPLSAWLAAVAALVAAINVFGGFLVTQRMLAMYKKREER
jgi:H+-translocating NAD(P) transhydrogenase subunit alpha